MRLTTKGRYAVTAMLDLALNANDKPITLVEISKRQEISLSYLEQLFARLRKHKLVISTRGPGGGYQLATAAKDINVAHVINAVDEIIDARRCKGKQNCQGDNECLTHELWTDLSKQMRNFLSSISLAQLVQRRKKREKAGKLFVCKDGQNKPNNKEDVVIKFN